MEGRNIKLEFGDWGIVIVFVSGIQLSEVNVLLLQEAIWTDNICNVSWMGKKHRIKDSSLRNARGAQSNWRRETANTKKLTAALKIGVEPCKGESRYAEAGFQSTKENGVVDGVDKMYIKANNRRIKKYIIFLQFNSF